MLRIFLLLHALASLFFASGTVAAESNDPNHLAERYERLLLLSKEEEGGGLARRVQAILQPELDAVVKAASSYTYDREGEIAYYDFKVFAESEISQERREQHAANKRFERVFSHFLPMLAYAYHTPGDNPHYQNEAVRDLYLKVLEYCYSRGLTEKAWFSDHAGRASGQALQSGLVRESGDFSDVSLHMGGFAQSLFLMRKELAEAGLLEKYRNVARNVAINTGTTYWAFFEHARADAAFEHGEGGESESSRQQLISENAYRLNADGVRLFVDYFIPYYLLIEEPEERRQMTEVLKQVIAVNVTTQPGTQDTIKPDGVGFHHQAAYVGGYSPYAFEAFATVLYLFSGEGYCQQGNVDAVKLALESFRVMAQQYTVSTSLRGRLLGISGDSAAVAITKAMALLAHPEGVGDADMQARFLEYFDQDYFFQGAPFADYYKGKRGVPIRGLGIYRLIDDLKKSRVRAANTPTGAWIKPYAAAGFFRRDDWLVTAKGFSRYFWDYEGPLNKHQNSFGQNWSYGLLQVFSAGDPVSELGSGCDLWNGWDWYHIPGTTASHYPIERRSEKRVAEDRKRSGIPQRSIHRNYSSKTFVGGVSFGDHGMYVLDMEAVPFTSPTDLRARKSYFFVGDKVLALGTGISGGTESDPTHTTLFQTKLTLADAITSLNEKRLRGLNTRECIDPGTSVFLIDSVGNAYYLAESSSRLIVERRLQKSMTESYEPTEGAYAQAYLDHGIKPSDESYQYVLIPDDRDGRKLKRFARKPEAYYQVLEKEGMHLVRFPEEGITAYAFYEQIDTPAPQKVKRSSHAAAVMTKEKGRELLLAASVPDIGWESDWEALQAKGLGYAAEYYYRQEAKRHRLQLTLRGKWELSESEAGVACRIQGEETFLELACSDGLSRKVRLTRAQ